MSNDDWECLGCEASNGPDADLCHLCGLAKNANFGDVNQVRKEWLGKRRPKAVEEPPWRAADTPSDYAIGRSAPDTLDLIPNDDWQCRGCKASNEPDAVVCHVCGLAKNANAQDAEPIAKVWSGKATPEPAEDQTKATVDKAVRERLQALLIVPLVLVSLVMAILGDDVAQLSAIIFLILVLIIGAVRGRSIDTLALIPDDAWQCRGCEASNEPDTSVCHVCGLAKNTNTQNGEQVAKVCSGTAAPEPAEDLPEGIGDKAVRWICKAFLIVPLVLIALIVALTDTADARPSAIIPLILALIIGAARGRALAIIFFIGGAIIVAILLSLA